VVQVKVFSVGGKHVGIVKAGSSVVYMSHTYLTERMARADINCWIAFHPQELEVEYTLYRQHPNGEFLYGTYATKEEAWKAIRGKVWWDPVTIYENGREIATFWHKHIGSSPSLTTKGAHNPVYALLKWGEDGWDETGWVTRWIGAKGVRTYRDS